MRYAGQHLPHGGKLVGLYQLLFQSLQLRDVAAGNYHAIDFAGFIEERAKVAAQAAPLALFVAHTNFQRSKSLPAAYNFREEAQQSRAVFHVRAAAKIPILGLFWVVAQDVFHARADKGVMPGRIHHKYEVWKTVDQPAGEFLLLVQAPLHLAALRNIHYGSVVANDAAVCVPYGPRGVQTDQRPSILARQGNLAALHQRLTIDLLTKGATLRFIRKQIGKRTRQKLFLGVITQHSRERRIDIDKASFRRYHLNPFLQYPQHPAEAALV